MKKLLIVALVLFTVNGFAQGERKDRMGHKKMAQQLKDMTPEERASFKSKKLTLDLTLDEKQQSKVYDLILAGAQGKDKMREARKANRDKDIKPSKEELAELRNHRLDKLIAFKREMKSILSEDQFSKFEKISVRKGRKGRKGRKKSKHRNKKRK